MTRNLKALGLALVAMLAMSAVAASGASAQTDNEFHSAIDETVLTAHHEEPEAQIFETGTGLVSCPSIGGNATIEGKTVEHVKFYPKYPATETETSGCFLQKGETKFAAHIKMNTCYYTFSVGQALDEEHHEYSGAVSIGCDNPGDEITVNVTFLGERECLHIPPHTPTKPDVDYTNTTDVVVHEEEEETEFKDVFVESTVEGITYTETGICSGRGTLHKNDGIYDGGATIIGEDHEKNRTDVWVT